MIFRLLPVLAILGAWPASARAQEPPPPPGPPVVAPAPSAGPPPTVGPILISGKPAPPPAPEWPPRMLIRPLTPPNVSNAGNYPPEAQRRQQEGLVVYELLVTRDGTPRACRTYRSSGFVALDNGTCDLAMRLRFPPPVDYEGKPVEATVRGQIMWLLAPHPVALALTEMAASLTIRDGTVRSCETIGDGPLYAGWRRTACLMIRAERKYYLGDRDIASGRAVVTVRLFPTGPGEAVVAVRSFGPVRASQRVDFSLDRRGNIGGCRTVRNHGFGTLRVDGRYPCGNFFLSQTWFDKVRREAPARTGAIEVQVYVTEAGKEQTE